MELKSSANESCYLPRDPAQFFVVIRVESREHHKVKDRSIWSAGNWSENFTENPQNSFEITYVDGSIALEGTVVDLDIGNIGINSTALEVACPAPGIGAKI